MQDEKAIAAMGILNTIETLLTVLEDSPEITKNLEPIVLQIVVNVLQNEVSCLFSSLYKIVVFFIWFCIFIWKTPNTGCCRE